MDKQVDNLVTIKALSFARGERVIFNNIDIDIPKGQVTAIVGPSGTGKTTLLQLMGGQLAPCAGCVEFDGQNVASLNRSQLYAMRKRMGMLFQNGGLFTHYDVFDNVAFPLRELTDYPQRLIEKLVLMKLQSVGLRGASRLMPSELSGGMARRVALARSIVLDPDLIMYDEPFAGLDPIAKGVIVRLIRELNQALGMTSVIVSHDVKDTFAIADKAYILAEGKIMAQGDPQALYADTSPMVTQFLNGLADGVVPFHYPAPPYRQALGV